ncbi:hypothetical protein ACLI09_00605 [Flavobacterium sp. RHBU_24]|uniref:hypothetical protein n=1 Tax=Flavobacterium sp. RHBU_24 TaxID=3391185 RepID=UPI0039848E3B
MSTLYTGQIFLIDADFERAENFKKKINALNNSIFFNYFPSIIEAFNMVLDENFISPEFIYVHVSLASFEAKDILKKLRKINKTQFTKVIVFGETITDAHIAAAAKYDFTIIKTFPNDNQDKCALFSTKLTSENRVMVCSTECKCC